MIIDGIGILKVIKKIRSQIVFLFCLFGNHCGQYYYVLEINSKAEKIFPHCSKRFDFSDQMAIELPSNECVNAIEVMFQSNGLAKEKAYKGLIPLKEVAKALAWLLEGPEIFLPENLSILGMPGLKIPKSYICILRPELDPAGCGYDKLLESNRVFTSNERLFHYLVESLERVDYLANDWKTLASAEEIIDGKGGVNIYPLFLEHSRIYQLSVLLHETIHFHSGNLHLACSGGFHCDQSALGGAWGAGLVVAELYFQAYLRETHKKRNQACGAEKLKLGSDSRANNFYKFAQYSWQRKQLGNIYRIYCDVLPGRILNKTKLPDGYIEVCAERVKGQKNFEEALVKFLEKNRQLFGLNQKNNDEICL